MNDDGNTVKIPHGPQTEEEPTTETSSEQIPDEPSIEEPIESPNIEPENETEDAAEPEPVQTPTEDAEPVDIFASDSESTPETPAETAPTSHLSNNPFNSRSRFQSTNKPKSTEVPQFFNDAIVASTPIEEPKKFNKGLIFGGIAVIAILLVVVIVLVVIPKPNPNQGGDEGQPYVEPQASSKLKKQFIKYYNYLMANVDSEEEEAYIEYSEKSGIYADNLIKGFINVKNKDGYFDTLKGYFDNFQKTYIEEYGDNSVEDIDNYYYYCAKYSTLPIQTLINHYSEDGKAETYKFIQNRYSIESKNKLVTTYFENMTKYEQNNLDLVELGANNNCISNTSLDTNCLKRAKGYKSLIKTGNNYFTKEENAKIKLEQKAKAKLGSVHKTLIGTGKGGGANGSD